MKAMSTHSTRMCLLLVTTIALVLAQRSIAMEDSTTRTQKASEPLPRRAERPLSEIRELMSSPVEDMDLLLSIADNASERKADPTILFGPFDHRPFWSNYGDTQLVALGMLADSLQQIGYNKNTMTAYGVFSSYMEELLKQADSYSAHKTILQIYFYSLFPHGAACAPPDTPQRQRILSVLISGEGQYRVPELLFECAYVLPEKRNELIEVLVNPRASRELAETILKRRENFAGAPLSFEEYQGIRQKASCRPLF